MARKTEQIKIDKAQVGTYLILDFRRKFGFGANDPDVNLSIITEKGKIPKGFEKLGINYNPAFREQITGMKIATYNDKEGVIVVEYNDNYELNYYFASESDYNKEKKQESEGKKDIVSQIKTITGSVFLVLIAFIVLILLFLTLNFIKSIKEISKL